MKKLMIAVAIVCAAAFAHATSYNWAASCDGIYAPAGSAISDEGGALIAGLPVYIFDANVVSIGSFATEMAAADLATLLAKSLTTTAGNQYVAGGDWGAFASAGFGDWDATNPDPTKVGLTAVGGVGEAYAVILDNADPTAATKFFVTAPVENIDCGGLVASMGNDAAITFGEIDASGDWNTITAAPEPTSGLLLLLGVAGLALRRRRA